MKIEVDRDVCQGLGMCESMAHEVFEVDDDGMLIIHEESPPEAKREEVAAAVESCPVQALRLQG
ncbi:ferredoxin [Nocardioidaceae bacterium]|nr:ferredoxin [Nocardioidaceae bacterium]